MIERWPFPSIVGLHNYMSIGKIVYDSAGLSWFAGLLFFDRQSVNFFWGNPNLRRVGPNVTLQKVGDSIIRVLHYYTWNWLYFWSSLTVMNEWINEWNFVSNWKLIRALNIESNLARLVIIQIPTQSPGRYIQLSFHFWSASSCFSFQANSPYVPSNVRHIYITHRW